MTLAVVPSTIVIPTTCENRPQRTVIILPLREQVRRLGLTVMSAERRAGNLLPGDKSWLRHIPELPSPPDKVISLSQGAWIVGQGRRAGLLPPRPGQQIVEINPAFSPPGERLASRFQAKPTASEEQFLRRGQPDSEGLPTYYFGGVHRVLHNPGYCALLPVEYWAEVNAPEFEEDALELPLAALEDLSPPDWRVIRAADDKWLGSQDEAFAQLTDRTGGHPETIEGADHLFGRKELHLARAALTGLPFAEVAA